jgi:hypothetical protein
MRRHHDLSELWRIHQFIGTLGLHHPKVVCRVAQANRMWIFWGGDTADDVNLKTILVDSRVPLVFDDL